MYRLLFSLVLSRMDPEDAHHLAFRVIRMLPALGFGRLVGRNRPRRIGAGEERVSHVQGRFFIHRLDNVGATGLQRSWSARGGWSR